MAVLFNADRAPVRQQMNLSLEVGKTQQLTAVAAIASGNAVITATADGKQGAANVTVSSPPQPAKTIKRVTIEYSDGTTETRP